ncbi:MAG: DUF86 domain-containing protein [Candidatus Altiarchaeales archaeon]|nr:DUF86 domain-containing protein [Candidatus Altiarchaeales archaeon]
MKGKRRRPRYFQKLAELDDKAEFIKKNLGGRGEFLRNRILRKAMYKEFQELVEVVSDLSAMIVKDDGRVVEDDYSNLEGISKILNLDETLTGDLKKANGLRNILIHEYNGIIDRQAYKSIGNILPSIEIFGEKLGEWLKD